MSDASEVVLCPKCLFPAGGTVGHRKCTNPLCGAEIDKGDWPKITCGENLAPWSSANLLPPAGGTGAYTMPPLQEMSGCGVLQGSSRYEFKEDQQVVYIGSDYKANVEIRGASPIHAVLLRHRYTGEWWIYDCGSATGTFVLDRRVHCRRLRRGAVIAIAGVQLMFRGDCLDSNFSKETGLSLRIENLDFITPKKQVLQDVSLEVRPGEFIGILGPSGCGKSSLIQRIIGLPGGKDTVVKGRILVNGNEVLVDGKVANDECLASYRLATSYLPQNVNETLHGELTLDEELGLYRRIHICESEDDAAELKDVLEVLELSKPEDRTSPVGEFSGGQKRRVGIALSLLRRPKLLLLDEPGAGLDPATEKKLMEHLGKISGKGKTVLCVTHLLEHMDLFSRILILSKNGEVVYFDSPKKVYQTFDVKEKDVGELYDRLDQGKIPVRYGGIDSGDPSQEPLPEIATASFLPVVGGYLARYFKEFVKGGHLPKFLVLYPLILIFGIRFACACYFRANGGKPVSGFDTLAFCASLGMFWLGINNAARSLVRERIPGRSLEALNQVPLFPYLTAKLAWSIVLCACQALSFTALLCLAGRIPIPLEKAIESPCLGISPLWYVPLFVSCVTGAFWGLAVSAISKVERTAISWVPNLAILALLFSKTLIRFGYDTFYSPVAKFVATRVMPCYWPSVVMEDMQSGVSDFSAVGTMLAQLLVYVIVSVVLICYFQKRNENAWSGR